MITESSWLYPVYEAIATMELIPEPPEVAERCFQSNQAVAARVCVCVLRCVTCRQLSEAQVLHGSGGDQWFLGVVQDMSQRVHPHVEVGDVDAHGLFAHGRLVRVPGRLTQKIQWVSGLVDPGRRP